MSVLGETRFRCTGTYGLGDCSSDGKLQSISCDCKVLRILDTDMGGVLQQFPHPVVTYHRAGLAVD